MTLPPSASTLYNFLEGNAAPEHLRIEVASAPFAQLRCAVRNISALLADVPEAQSLVYKLQYELLGWLSLPLPAGAFDVSPLNQLAPWSSARGLWGDDVGRQHESATAAYSRLLVEPISLRSIVDEVLLDEAAEANKLRLYCSKSAEVYFTSLPSWTDVVELAEVTFMNSPRDYRSAEPFDTLVKVGPLRSRGVSSIPGAVVNAPRFKRLVQIVWADSPDEPGFGSDLPIQCITGTEVDGDARDGQQGQGTSTGLVWNRATVRRGVLALDESSSADVPDDFAVRRTPVGAEGDRSAILLQLANEMGCLQAPHAEILCLRTTEAGRGIAQLKPLDLDDSVSHMVAPDLAHVDFGPSRALDGRYSRAWKAALRSALDTDERLLLARLAEGGLRLHTLQSRVHDWARPASNVITAPQQRKHLAILIEILGIGTDVPFHANGTRMGWADFAWAEIARSRGEAIQHGTEAHAILVDELRHILEEDVLRFSSEAREGESFTWELSEGRSLTGRVSFHALVNSESGYRCPHALLRTIKPIEELIPWRA